MSLSFFQPNPLEDHMSWNPMLCAAALVFLTGCNDISPFVGEDLKSSICDRDGDSLARASDYCGGNDCNDGDENVGAPTSWYRDVDTDTFGAGEASPACSQPDGFVAVPGDCDDTDETINLLATEVCDLIDNDCDDLVDEENIPTWYEDGDTDGYGSPDESLVVCDQPDGYVDNATDCDDSTDAVSPQDAEICDDGIDQDCNEVVDDADGAQLWCADTDLDSFGDPDACLYSCALAVDGHVQDTGDCDDGAYDISPVASEACEDDIDNDCDGEVDTDAVDVLWYRDADTDGYGDALDSQLDCAPPAGYVGNAGDCDDMAATVNPGAPEVCNNGVDDTCDTSALECRFSGVLDPEAADLKILGSNGFGSALVGSMDLNGDGINDLAVGAYQDGTGGTNAGAVYVFFGPLSDVGQINAEQADAVLVGAEQSLLAQTLVSIDDLNGDGIEDLAVDAAGTDTVYVLWMPLSSGESNITDLPAARFLGAQAGSITGRGFGISSGDLSGDGVHDLVVGASESSKVFVVNGPLTSGSFSLPTVATTTFLEEDQLLGCSVAVGEVSGDTQTDLAAGSRNAQATNTGAVYSYFGPLDVGLQNTVLGNNNDRLGADVLIEDVNGDGNGDLIMTSGQVNSARIFLGPLSPGTTNISSSSTGLSTSTWDARLGSADMDEDGVGDVFVAESPTGGYVCGTNSCVHLHYGDPDLPTFAAADATWYVDTSNRVSVPGTQSDLTGDGYSDVLIGASSSATVYLIHGSGL